MTDPLLDAKKFSHVGFYKGFAIFLVAAILAVSIASMTARNKPVFVTTMEEAEYDRGETIR